MTYFNLLFLCDYRPPFPCLTTGGNFAGKPCVFPFNYPDCGVADKPASCAWDSTLKTYETCTSVDVDDRRTWCATRTYDNRTYITGVYK